MHSESDSGGWSGTDDVSWEEGHKLPHVTYDRRDVKDHPAGVTVLPELIVHSQPHRQVARIWHFIPGSKKWAEGSKGIRTLALHPLSSALKLEAPLGIVIVKCVAGNELQGLFLPDVGGLLPDHHGEFHFPIQFFGVLGNDDRVIRTDHRRRGFHENHWFLRQLCPALDDMFAVVGPDADDLARPTDR